MSVPGKLMGCAALGNATGKLLEATETYFRAFIPKHFSLIPPLPAIIVRAACGTKEAQRDLAASIQEAFQRVALEIVMSVLKLSGLQQQIEGIVLTGGCALNVLFNQLVLDECQRTPGLEHLDVFVPAAANDAGVALGVQCSTAACAFSIWSSWRRSPPCGKPGAWHSWVAWTSWLSC